MKWVGQAFAYGFDIGLFASPAAEEGAMEFVAIQVLKGAALVHGKETLCQFSYIALGANFFNIDANLVAEGERHQREAFGVRDIEAHGGILQEWFAVLGVPKGDLGGAEVKVLREQGSQRAARQNVVASWVLHAIPVRLLAFFGQKQFVTRLNGMLAGIEGPLPEMYNTGPQLARN